jgi:rRNA-processing protein FCF1
MYTIVLDTNIILDCLKFKIDLFKELERICNFKYEIKILDKTLDELKNKKNEKLALKLIKQKNIKLINTQKGYVDDLLFNLGENYVIATNDKALKTKLKSKNYPIITLRQKKYLIIQNVL